MNKEDVSKRVVEIENTITQIETLCDILRNQLKWIKGYCRGKNGQVAKKQTGKE